MHRNCAYALIAQRESQHVAIVHYIIVRGVLFLVHNFTCLYLNYNSLHNASVVQLHSQYTCTEMILHAPLLYIYFTRINSFYFWVLKGTKEHAISHMIESKRRKLLLLVVLLYIVAAAAACS